MEVLTGGRLRGLGGHQRGGIVWVDGRVRKEELADILGTVKLPIIMAEELLVLE